MRTLLLALAVLGLGTSLAVAQGTSSGSSNANCKVVELKPGEAAPSAGLSTSITAGNGKVTGTTTLPDGTSVSSSSGSSSSSSSIATSSSSDGRSTVITDSNGNCTIYRRAEAGK